MKRNGVAIIAIIVVLILIALQYPIRPEQPDTSKPTEVAKSDSDNDGLADEEELRLGTDPKKPDTDDDGLTDYQEVKIYKTDPRSGNTDRDRYKDGEEIKRGSNPIVANTAKINITKQNIRGDYDLVTIGKLGLVSVGLGGCVKLTLGACAALIPGVAPALGAMLEDTVYKSQVTFALKNIGDDYTDHLKYDVTYKLGNDTLASQQDSYGRLDVGQTIAKTYTHEIKVKDIAATLWNLILHRGDIRIEVQNLDYERF